MNPLLAVRVALTAAVLLHGLAGSRLQAHCPGYITNAKELHGCRSTSCLTCQNAPAVCSVDHTGQVVSCKGDTSSCTVRECDLCSRCVAYYGGNLTSFRYASACISRDYPFNCASTPAKCVRSDVVMGTSSLFNSSKLWCSCYGENCTSELSFRYTVLNHSDVVVPTALRGPSISPDTDQHVPSEMGEVELQSYEVAIALLSVVLLLTLTAALTLVGLRTRKLLFQVRAEHSENSFKFKKFANVE